LLETLGLETTHGWGPSVHYFRDENRHRLERMGDEAMNIAERAIPLNYEPQLKPYIDIPRMAETAQSMVRDVLGAFVNRNSKQARSVCERDDLVDGLNDQVFRELLTYMMSDPTTITRAAHLLIVSRNLERIADHATNIAQNVIFMVDALVIKNHADVKEETKEAWHQ
jgi:phosphate transport system protein